MLPHAMFYRDDSLKSIASFGGTKREIQLKCGLSHSRGWSMYLKFQDPLKSPFMSWDLTPWNLKRLGDYKLTVGVPTKLLVPDLTPWGYFQTATSLVPRRILFMYLLCNISCYINAQRPGSALLMLQRTTQMKKSAVH